MQQDTKTTQGEPVAAKEHRSILDQHNVAQQNTNECLKRVWVHPREDLLVEDMAIKLVS